MFSGQNNFLTNQPSQSTFTNHQALIPNQEFFNLCTFFLSSQCIPVYPSQSVAEVNEVLVQVKFMHDGEFYHITK